MTVPNPLFYVQKRVTIKKHDARRPVRGLDLGQGARGHRIYEVLDPNIPISGRYLIEVCDCRNADLDWINPPVVRVRLLKAPSGSPPRIHALTNRPCYFFKSKGRHVFYKAYALLSFERPLSKTTARYVPANALRDLPSWFQKYLKSDFCDSGYAIGDDKLPDDDPELLCVGLRNWCDNVFVGHYMIARVYAAFKKFCFIDRREKRQILAEFGKFPSGLQHELAEWKVPKSSANIPKWIHEGRAGLLESFANAYRVHPAHIRWYLTLRCDEEAPWDC